MVVTCLFAQLAVVEHACPTSLGPKALDLLSCFLLTKEKAFFGPLTKGTCPLTKGTPGAVPPKRNSKNKPAGSGCVSNKRREEFKKKGLERENKNMKLEDDMSSKVDWEEDKRVGNRKVRKLSAGDIAEMLKPKPKEEQEKVAKKDEEKKEAKKEEEKNKVSNVGEHKPDPPLDKRGGEGSLDKRDVPPAKTFGPSQEQKKKEKQWTTKVDLSSEDEPVSLTKGKDVACGSRDEPGSLTKGNKVAKVTGGRTYNLSIQKAPPVTKSWKLKANPAWRVAVDWYNTIKLPHRPVPPAHIAALHQLILVSFCGQTRELEVREEASLGVTWNQMRFTREKDGDAGKVALCKALSIGAIFDDDDEVLWDAEQQGFPYYAIRTKRHLHSWANRTYYNLPEAVDDFLRRNWPMT